MYVSCDRYFPYLANLTNLSASTTQLSCDFHNTAAVLNDKTMQLSVTVGRFRFSFDSTLKASVKRFIYTSINHHRGTLSTNIHHYLSKHNIEHRLINYTKSNNANHANHAMACMTWDLLPLWRTSTGESWASCLPRP